MRSAEGDSKGSHVKLKKYVPHILILLLAVAIAAILWLTLFSRLGTESRHFYPPLWSYRTIAHGSGAFIFQNIGNIMLFIPIGVIAALFFRQNIKQSILIGFALSLIIECCQWFFWLGSFEFDDLIHNSIGAGIGAFLVDRTAIGEWLKQQAGDKKKSLIVIVCLVVLLITLPLGYQEIKVQEMKRLAALNDRDGRKNLLILSPDPRYIGQSDVSVIYNSDGSVLIEGKAENRAWIQIARFSLSPGQYYMEGMSGLQKKTVGLELAVFDNDQDKYVMLGHEVGSVERLDFELHEQSKMEVLISLYPGWEGSVTAYPSIFREDL